MKDNGEADRGPTASSRERILAAARHYFFTEGYQAVSLRRIAGEAGVDVALIAYYFGSKRGLFSAALSLPANPLELLRDALDGDVDALAERVLRRLLTTWDHPTSGPPLRALMTAATSQENFNVLVSEAASADICDAVASRLGGPDAEARAAVFTTQTLGLVFSRYVLRVEPIASWPMDTVVAVIAPRLQQVLSGPWLTSAP
ncbi:MAG: TetR family transcriptional regulator [Actinomycetota bacterium]|uniref:TetR family transcriptional regulator n=1 Tax=Mycobacterium lentiflavum TaxID=141349 RepID=A0ABY3UVP8_MYCLN|nr:TetR family transcriptional regulator [Mycobacterium lentiflavum]MEE3064983.1 TetR family transcriptional regulator [Actinomycetota bacterium]ULP43661.1 TetR family transcriptional regulator [Mycobacterium lentiflavum]